MLYLLRTHAARAQDSRSLAGIITQAFSKRLWLGHLQLLYRLVRVTWAKRPTQTEATAVFPASNGLCLNVKRRGLGPSAKRGSFGPSAL